MRLALIAAATLLALSACDSPSNPAPAPAPTPANAAPVVTSATTASVMENAPATSTIYQATATDADGDAITFSLAGTDAASFILSSAGALRFSAAPDFETPADADRNNVYAVELRASDGKTTTAFNLQVTVTNEAGAHLRDLGAYAGASFVAAVPGDKRIFVAENRGEIYLRDPEAAGPGTLYLTVPDLAPPLPQNVWGQIRTGVLTVAAAPDYATSGVIYVAVTNGAYALEVRRYGRSGGLGDPTSGDVIFRLGLTAPHDSTTSNIGGWIGFGPDGYLYITTGLRNTDLIFPPVGTLYGKILRVDVSRDDFPADPDRDYAIPASNPRPAGTPDETYFYGLRDPRNASFDGGEMWVGDGRIFGMESRNQQIFRIRPEDAGRNADATSPSGLRPAADYNWTVINNYTEVIGGYVYRGPVPDLQGTYIFGDFNKGWLLGVPLIYMIPEQTLALDCCKSPNYPINMNTALDAHEKTLGYILSFGNDSLNNVYLIHRTATETRVKRIEAR